jgi:Fe-S-cluster containining protein
MKHQLDEFGEHGPEECEECLLSQAVTCRCRCGRCCESLIIEASLLDGEREPLIAKRAKPLYDDMTGVKEQIGWLLNGNDGPCVFFDRQTRLCTIYETRPLVCRLYNCDDGQLEKFLNEFGELWSK